MKYYVIVDNNILISESAEVLIQFYNNSQALPEDYVEGKYIVQDGELVPNKNYEAEQAQKEKERIQELFMTRSDFFDCTIRAWRLREKELLVLIENLLATLPVDEVDKLVAINNFENAQNFYRKHTLFNMIVIAPLKLSETTQVIITDEHLDKLFDEVAKGNKETAWQYLPQPELIPIPEPVEPEVPVEPEEEEKEEVTDVETIDETTEVE